MYKRKKNGRDIPLGVGSESIWWWWPRGGSAARLSIWGGDGWNAVEVALIVSDPEFCDVAKVRFWLYVWSVGSNLWVMDWIWFASIWNWCWEFVCVQLQICGWVCVVGDDSGELWIGCKIWKLLAGFLWIFLVLFLSVLQVFIGKDWGFRVC